jgi:hypothetical protein
MPANRASELLVINPSDIHYCPFEIVPLLSKPVFLKNVSADQASWAALSDQQREEINERHAENERSVESHLLLCNETIHMVMYVHFYIYGYRYKYI